MWRLKAFWCLILPFAVNLNRFFALELVLTFGIVDNIYFYTLLAFRTGGNLWSLVGNQNPGIRIVKRAAKLWKKIKILCPLAKKLL
jgi:hypothetical protein